MTADAEAEVAMTTGMPIATEIGPVASHPEAAQTDKSQGKQIES